MEIHKSISLVSATLVLLVSIIIAYFLPPAGLLLSPVTMSLMVWIILFGANNFGILTRSALCYLYIGLSDIGLKLFAGGIHDIEGMGFMSLLFFVGLIPCFIMLLTTVYRATLPNKWVKIISILGFILLIWVHIGIFKRLGLDHRYDGTHFN